MATQKVQPSAPAAPKSNAKPGTKDDAGKKEKKVRVVYPGLIGTDIDPETKKPVRLKLKAIPEDFDLKKHKPLMRKDFENEANYFLLRAQIADRMAAKFRELATESEKTGGLNNQKGMKRVVQMHKRMSDMLAALKKDNPNVDIDAMLKELTAQMTPEAGNGEESETK